MGIHRVMIADAHRLFCVCRVVFASSCGDVVPWLQPDWVLILDGKGERSATLYQNPNCGAPSSTFQPRITTIVSTGDATISDSSKDARSACEKAWSLKSMADIDVRKTVRESKNDKPKPLTIQVATDEATTRAGEAFDYEFDGKSEFQPPTLPQIPDDFTVGLLVGPSGSGMSAVPVYSVCTVRSMYRYDCCERFGSIVTYLKWDAGKTTILKSNFHLPDTIEWAAGKSVGSYLSSADGRERLRAVGLPEGV